METFIPFRRTDLIALCAQDAQSGATGASEDRLKPQLWQSFAALLSARYHHDYHARLERLKDAWAPLNPDRDTRLLTPITESIKANSAKTLVSELKDIVEAANYTAITAEDLRNALQEESLFRVRLHVDFEDFDEVLFFRRGEQTRRETVRTWFGLVKKRIEFVNYERVVAFVRFKDADYFNGQGREDLLFTPGSTMLKLFQDVPRADLEMLFPNTEVRMKTSDKVLIGVPAAVSGIVVLSTKLGATLVLCAALLAFWAGLSNKEVVLDQAALLALASGLGALGAYLWKQFSSFKNRKIRFMKALADNLYFKNLDNNVGVFHHLIDAAEEEDCKEALLAYYFLLTRGPQTAKELDQCIENWFDKQHNTQLNFDIGDALGKLGQLGLLSRHEEKHAAIPIADALRVLDAYWDQLFQPDAA